MKKHKVLDLFAGLGGFSLGLGRTGGFETVAFCEIEKFPQTVLAKHWPDVPIYNDVMELTNDRLRADGIFPTVITGGFPCQDISVAGNQKGIDEGTRSGLWSECARLVGSVRPKWAIFENVSALLSGGGSGGEWFQRVLFDISQIGGYVVEWHCISASDLGVHHHRDSIWAAEPSVCGVADGISDGVYEGRVTTGVKDRAKRLKALGNSVVPQIPELIGRAILEAENG
jgi:DNA (cytosine-5)-methyltransferase 1